uniref:Uncharacterized protein n=1 Tax=Glossina brevipalpis TaxID=37001 RepID=A0A1A9W065_9MUSC
MEIETNMSRSRSAKTDLSVKSKNKLPEKVTKKIVPKGKAPIIKEKLNEKQIKKQKIHINTLRNTSRRKIPRKTLMESLQMLRNSDHEIWTDQNVSCNPSIHRCYENNPAMTNTYVKLQYARQCLLRRDWKNLIKVLNISMVDEKESCYYPLFVKYAAICLAHVDRQQFNIFTKVITASDPETIMKKCTEFNPNIERCYKNKAK